MNAIVPVIAPAESRALAPLTTLPAWLDRAAYPFAPRLFATTDGTMSYVDEGAGESVLLVHGTPSWSFEWRHVIQALTNTHRCIAPDHLGFGLSDKLPADAPLTPADHARRLASLVEALDLRDVTLVVHDFGGPIGLHVALAMPERIARIVVVNSWMWPNGDDPGARKVDRLVRSWLGRFLYRWLNASPRWIVPAAFGDRTKLTRDVHRHYLAPFGARVDREAPYALACALVGADAFYATLWDRRTELQRFPITIVWGEKDPAFGATHLARWIEAFPRAKVKRLPGVGHFVAEESPESIVDAVGGRR